MHAILQLLSSSSLQNETFQNFVTQLKKEKWQSLLTLPEETQKTPRSEIELAKEIKKEYFNEKDRNKK